MKSLTIVGGSNIVARNAIKRLAKKIDKIKLCDYRPHRPAVWNLEAELKKSEISVEKVKIFNNYAFERALEGSENVLYFSHDYFSMTPDKNAFLKGTAELSKKHGVKKLIAICPIEFDHYSEIDTNPLLLREEAELSAIEAFPELKILRPNLIYGEESYLCRFFAQTMILGKVLFPKKGDGSAQPYLPIHMDDIINSIEDILNRNTTQLEGSRYSIVGKTQVVLNELLDLIAKYTGVTNFTKSKRKDYIDFFEKLIIGRCHDKNMMKMLELFETNPTDFQKEADYMTEVNLTKKSDVKAFYTENSVTPENLETPFLYKYKTLSLD